MNRKTAPMLMIAVVCGLGAMVASSQLLSRGEAAPAPETQQIVLAARDLAVEEVLKPELIRLETVPKTAVPPGAFTSFRDMADRWVQTKIFEGEPVVDRKLAPKGTPPGLIARIPRGKRAFALTINEQTGVSGFIQPDHRVDVFQVKSSNGSTRAVPVLQDLQVLASGTSTTTADRAAPPARTVTVSVTPEEAAILTAAQAGGQLSLALRALDDHEKTEVVEPKVEELPRVSLAPPPAPAPPEPKPEPRPAPAPALPRDEEMPRHVTIYRGPGKPPERIRVDKPPGEEDSDSDSGGLGGFPSAAEIADRPPATGSPAGLGRAAASGRGRAARVELGPSSPPVELVQGLPPGLGQGMPVGPGAGPGLPFAAGSPLPPGLERMLPPSVLEAVQAAAARPPQ